MTAIALCLCIEAMLADDYAVREHGSLLAIRTASARYHARHVLRTAAAHHPSAEVRTRCGRCLCRVIGDYAIGYVPSSIPCWPCIDTGPDFHRRQEHIREWYGRAECSPDGCGGSPWWFRWRRATELWVRDMLVSERWTYADADSVLGEMWLFELAYHEKGFPAVAPVVRTWVRWDGGYPGR